MRNPLVTIGIPIYYGERFLEATLKNIFNQTFTDFEIIISDNNPGGEAEKIAEYYSEKYENVEYIRHEKNFGALQNWNYTIKNAKGKYYICAGAHDLWSDNFLEILVEYLENNPQAVLAYAPSILMNENGEILERNTSFVDTSGLDIISRFSSVFFVSQDALYGLMRTEVIKKTRLQLEIIGSGAVWLGEISFYGNFKVCSNIARYRRITRAKQSLYHQIDRYYKTLFSKKRNKFFAGYSFLWAYMSSVFVHKLDFKIRIRLLFAIFNSFLLKYGDFLIFKHMIKK